MSDPSRLEADRPSRLAQAAAVCGASGKFCPAERATQLLEAIIEPGDRMAIEGDNQKQADFRASALAHLDQARIHDLHMVQSALALPDHLAVSESLRRGGMVIYPSDLGIDVATATRDWLAAKTIDNLGTESGGLYAPPTEFRPIA